MSAERPRVLIVENDSTIASNIYDFLVRKGYAPDMAYEGHGALGMLRTYDFNAVILDIGLPGLDGYGVLQAMAREPGLWRPVLILTARDQLSDKLAAFALGAEDYLVKPFSLAEVDARLRVMLRRTVAANPDDIVEFAGLAYDPKAYRVSWRGQVLACPRKSVLILEILLRQAGQVVSHRVLERALWPSGPPSVDALRSQIHLLRKRLQEAGFNGIETVHGQGWRIVQPSVQIDHCISGQNQ